MVPCFHGCLYDNSDRRARTCGFFLQDYHCRGRFQTGCKSFPGGAWHRDSSGRGAAAWRSRASRDCCRGAYDMSGSSLPREDAPTRKVLVFQHDTGSKAHSHIRLDHFRPESAMLIMALGALHESFFQWVMGLPVLLRADISVAGIAEHGLLCLQVRFQPRMGIVAIVTGNAVDFVPAHIPERYCP